MTTATIIDNFFDQKFLVDLAYFIEHNISFNCSNIANSTTWPYGVTGSHRLFGTCIFLRNNLNSIQVLDKNAHRFFEIFEAIEDIILRKKVYLSQIDINLQHAGCDGTSHKDGPSNDTTIMIMSNSYWKSEWGGEFQMLSDDEKEILETHQYIPGRIIIFPSNVLHRGLGPKEKYIYRHTITFRVPEQHWYIDQSWNDIKNNAFNS